jgi:cyanate permease
VTVGLRHLWRTTALRQIVLGAVVALLVIGFDETLIFSVIQHGLHRSPTFFGVLGSLQGAGSIAGALVAPGLIRRLGDGRLVGVGLAAFAVGESFLVIPSLPFVLLGFAIAGVGVAWAIVGFTTALQLRTPLAIQGRVSAGADLSLSLAQTTSIAAGAALSTAVDFRILIVVIALVTAAAAAYLATRRELRAVTPAASPAAAG